MRSEFFLPKTRVQAVPPSLQLLLARAASKCFLEVVQHPADVHVDEIKAAQATEAVVKVCVGVWS